MDFELNEEQTDLAASVRGVLEQESPVSLAREMYEGGQAPEQPWKSARELGWTALPIPEAFGGLGLGPIELGLIAEEHGRVLATGPLLATLSQFVPAILELGDESQQRRFLEPVATGTLVGTLAVAGESGDATGRDPSLIARPDGDAWRLDGERFFVLDCSVANAAAADEIIVAAALAGGEGPGLFVVPGGEVETRRFRSFDASRPLASLVFNDFRVEPERVLGTPGEIAAPLDRILQVATAMIAFEMVGVCQSLFDLALDYAKHREQFGHPIGSFQAIQHKFSDLFISLEMARSTALYAGMTLAERDPRSAIASSMAKAAVGECQRRLCKEGIQIHGGLGYTWEQDVHLYVKRLKTGEALFGTTGVHRQRIASLLGLGG